MQTQTASFAAALDVAYQCNTASGDVTVTLPDPAGNDGSHVTCLLRGPNRVRFSRPVNGLAGPEISGDGTFVQLLIAGGSYKTGVTSMHGESVKELVGLRPSAAPTLGSLGGVAGYRRAYRIALAAGANGQAGYQLRLRIGESTAAAANDFAVRAGTFPAAEGDGGDFMFVRQDGTEVRFTVERVTGVAPDRVAHVWVALPNGTAADTIFLLTQSSLASSNRDRADLVFAFHDTFAGTALAAARWTALDATGVSVANGSMRHTSSTGRVRSAATFNDNVIVEALWRGAARAANGHVILGLADPAALAANAVGYLWHADNDFLRVNGTFTGVGTTLATGVDILTRLEVVDAPVFASDLCTTVHENYDTGAQLRSNLALKAVAGLPIVIGRRFDADLWLGQAVDVSWRWMRVRQNALAPTLGQISEV